MMPVVFVAEAKKKCREDLAAQLAHSFQPTIHMFIDYIVITNMKDKKSGLKGLKEDEVCKMVWVQGLIPWDHR